MRLPFVRFLCMVLDHWLRLLVWCMKLFVPLTNCLPKVEYINLLFLNRILYNIDPKSNTIQSREKKNILEFLYFKLSGEKKVLVIPNFHWHGTHFHWSLFYWLSVLSVDPFEQETVLTASHLDVFDTCLL